MDGGYVVAVKPSARRASRAAGEWVAESGRYRSFDSKALARAWALEASPQGRTLWIQDAHPLDDGRADGYLLARYSHRRGSTTDRPGEQVGLTEL